MNSKKKYIYTTIFTLIFVLSLQTQVYKIINAQTINSLSATTLPRSGRLLIDGIGFGDTQGSSQVLIDGFNAIATTWMDNKIHAYVPETSATGTVSVKVFTLNGLSNSKNLNVTLRQANGRVLWTFQADGNNLRWRPALAPNGTIYLHTNNATEGIVYAISPDGGLQWIQKVNWYPYVPPTAGPDGAVYVGSIGRVYRISSSGNIDWQYWDGVSRGPRVAPTIGPDGLLYGAFEGGIGVFAMEPVTGQMIWTNSGDPILSDKSGEATEMKFGATGVNEPVDQLYVSMDGGAGFYAFSIDGDQLFTSSLGNISGTAEAAIGSDGTIYGPRAIGLLVAALNPTDGSNLWQYDPPDWAVGTNNVEIGPDDMLYFVGSGAKLEAFDPKTQSRRWQEFTPIDALDRPTVSPDGSVLIVSGRDTDLFGDPGFVRAFVTGNGRMLWSLDLPFQLSPGYRIYGTHHPRITPDSRTAYLSTMTLAEWPLNQDPHSFLYALDITDGGSGPNQPPVAVASAVPTNGTSPLTVGFDASGSTDPDGMIVGYLWDFGDGNSSTESFATNTYSDIGSFVVTLTVTDGAGKSGSDSVTITVTAPGTCSLNCLRVTGISLGAKERRGVVTVTGKVKVQDEAGVKIQNANVFATWTLPDNTTQAQSFTTNRKGEAAFEITGNNGTYTLVVTDIVKTGMSYDPDNSTLSGSVTK